MSLPLLLLLILSLILPLSLQQPPLHPSEQESVYLALETINPSIPWRSLFPDDLCLSSPHGIICNYFPSSQSPNTTLLDLVPHIVELNFGTVSDSSQNPPCSPHSLFPLTALSLPHLRKLFFYRCFTHLPVSFPRFGPGLELEELIFMENPSLHGTISGSIRNLGSLRRVILTGSNVSGRIPDEITKLPLLEQVTISGNGNLGGGIPVNMGILGGENSKLRILDLSNNVLQGTLPKSLGEVKNLIKLDLSGNGFSGEIPASLGGLQTLEFLDLSYNKFGNYGVPLFLGAMSCLREVHLSGNTLGGVIPEIWEKLGGILGIGLSKVGLIGNIPPSMGVFLSNLSYLLLDGNKLEGVVPREFGLLENLNEVNLRNNQLSGRISFSAPFVAKVGSKLKLEGNPSLCVDKSMKKGSLGNLRTCNGSGTTQVVHNSALFNGSISLSVDWFLVILLGAFWSFWWL